MSTKKIESVLIVDDDSRFAAELADQFRALLVETRIAETAGDALKALQAKRVGLAVVDLCLGRDGLPSGLDLIPELRWTAPTVLIAVGTGYWSIPTCELAMQLGANAYFEKPTTAEAILTRIQRRLDPSVRNQALAFPTLESLEWEHIQRALQLKGGNVSQAAEILGIDRRSLLRRLSKKPAKS